MPYIFVNILCISLYSSEICLQLSKLQFRCPNEIVVLFNLLLYNLLFSNHLFDAKVDFVELDVKLRLRLIINLNSLLRILSLLHYHHVFVLNLAINFIETFTKLVVLFFSLSCKLSQLIAVSYERCQHLSLDVRIVACVANRHIVLRVFRIFSFSGQNSQMNLVSAKRAVL